MSKKKKKLKLPDVDGFGPKDIKRLMTAIAKIWSWNYARRMVIKRATNDQGYGVCEKCGEQVPKVYVDHITPRGSWDDEYIKRTFVPSTKMMAVCHPCHKVKTKVDNANTRAKKKKPTFTDQY